MYTNGNGEGTGTHLSVFLRILEGPFDSQLSWPLHGTFKCELLNQLEDNNHLTNILTFIGNNEASRRGTLLGLGYSKFIEQSALELDSSNNIQYLKDDNLYFKVSLEGGITHKHWLN